MLTALEDRINKKRVLKKVRVHYLHKRDDSEVTEVDPATKLLNGNQTYTLTPTIGLIEKNRKLCLGPEHLQPYFKIANAKIEEQINSKVLTLYLNQNDSNSGHIPWEYVAKRLESYGDLDLAVWAQRIRKHYVSYPKMMDEYFELVLSDNNNIYSNLLEINRKASSVCENIERTYPFYKIVHFMKRESDHIASLSYNDSFLNVIGHTAESLMTLTKKIGIPALFENDCQLYLDFLKNFFDDSLHMTNPVVESPEFKAPLINEKGSKKEVYGKFIYVCRPAHEGYFLYSYLVVTGTKVENIHKKSQNTCKCIKSSCDDVIPLEDYKF